MMLDRDVTSELGRVRYDDVIGHLAIMTYMGEGHDEIVVTNSRDPAALDRAEADADILTDSIFIADHKLGFAIGEAVILGRPAEYGATLNQVPFSYHHSAVGAADPRMRFHGCIRPNDDMAFDHAIRADLGRRRNLGVRGYDGSGVNTQTKLSRSRVIAH